MMRIATMMTTISLRRESSGSFGAHRLAAFAGAERQVRVVLFAAPAKNGLALRCT